MQGMTIVSQNLKQGVVCEYCEWLPCCTALITWGLVEQSNQNWMGLDRRHSVTRGGGQGWLLGSLL